MPVKKNSGKDEKSFRDPTLGWGAIVSQWLLDKEESLFLGVENNGDLSIPSDMSHSHAQRSNSNQTPSAILENEH